MIDLGKWANEEFRIAQPADAQDFLDDTSPSLT